LQFFLERYEPGMFFHFEMVPDRLPESLREIIAKFPPGALQFEVGIQTFNEETGALIKRRQNYARLEDNFRFLRGETGVHIHADLIVGLPGETVESFAAGFDRLVALQPQEIQVGILKRLRGTPISRHDGDWQMKYSANPPYEILQNKLIPFAEMQRLRRFAKYWDLVGNSGNFVETTPLLWSDPFSSGAPVSDPARTEPQNQPAGSETGAPFWAFLEFSDWLFARVRRTDTIALLRLMQMLFEFLTEVRSIAAPTVAQALWRDYQRGGRHDKPGFLVAHLPATDGADEIKKRVGPKRQARHLANNF
jgi:hypothetical protein